MGLVIKTSDDSAYVKEPMTLKTFEAFKQREVEVSAQLFLHLKRAGYTMDELMKFLATHPYAAPESSPVPSSVDKRVLRKKFRRGAATRKGRERLAKKHSNK